MRQASRRPGTGGVAASHYLVPAGPAGRSWKGIHTRPYCLRAPRQSDSQEPRAGRICGGGCRAAPVHARPKRSEALSFFRRRTAPVASTGAILRELGEPRTKACCEAVSRGGLAGGRGCAATGRRRCVRLHRHRRYRAANPPACSSSRVAIASGLPTFSHTSRQLRGSPPNENSPPAFRSVPTWSRRIPPQGCAVSTLRGDLVAGTRAGALLKTGVWERERCRCNRRCAGSGPDDRGNLAGATGRAPPFPGAAIPFWPPA